MTKRVLPMLVSACVASAVVFAPTVSAAPAHESAMIEAFAAEFGVNTSQAAFRLAQQDRLSGALSGLKSQGVPVDGEFFDHTGTPHLSRTRTTSPLSTRPASTASR